MVVDKNIYAINPEFYTMYNDEERSKQRKNNFFKIFVAASFMLALFLAYTYIEKKNLYVPIKIAAPQMLVKEEKVVPVEVKSKVTTVDNTAIKKKDEKLKKIANLIVEKLHAQKKKALEQKKRAVAAVKIDKNLEVYKKNIAILNDDNSLKKGGLSTNYIDQVKEALGK